MTTKHTSGPWAVVDGYYPSFKEVTGPSFKVSAVMWATDLTEDDYQKRNADLHLIAAAPDLLEALIECEYIINHCLFGCDAENVTAKARFAISKATGQSQ
jgi:hypothetical protein